LRSTLTGLCVAFALIAPNVRADERHRLFIARVGAYAPRVSQSDDLRAERSRTFALDRQDWLGVLGGVELAVRATSFLELGQHVDGLATGVDGPKGGLGKGRSLFSDVVVAGLSARLFPTGPDARFTPYLATGPDLVFWRYKETISASERKTNGTSAGFHLAGGVRVFVARNLAVSAEYRRQFAGDDMKGDFAGEHLDLTGDLATLGLTYRF